MIDSPTESNHRACVIARFVLSRGRQLYAGITDAQVEWRCGTKAYDTLVVLIDSPLQDMSQVRFVLDTELDEWAFGAHPGKVAA